MNRDSLLATLDNASANATDVYLRLYEDYFVNGDEPDEALRIILEYPREIGDVDDNNPQGITRQEENRITNSLENVINGTVNRIADMNLTQREFYTNLYKSLFESDNGVFPQSKEEKAITLKILSENVRAVPYYQVMEIDRISREEFNEEIDNLETHLQEAYYMLNRQFSTTPARAAEIVRIADTIEDRKRRIVFWTVIINSLRNVNEKE